MVPSYFRKHKREKTRLAKWGGGKGNYAKKIIPYIPSGKRYCEPYAGMANVFLQIDAVNKYPIIALNDINSDIINLMRVLQDEEKYLALEHKLVFTPYSYEAFCDALNVLQSLEENDVIRAHAFFTAQNQGFSGISHSPGNWGRVINPDVEKEPNIWQCKISNLEAWHKLVMGVYLDNRDALEFIKYWDVDDGETVFYLDPPYITDTRKSKVVYDYETDNQHHIDLVSVLLNIHGKAVLSCYDHEIYKPLLDAGWKKIQFDAHASMATKGRGSSVRDNGVPKRTETIYIKE